jgi:hypothetical protein
VNALKEEKLRAYRFLSLKCPSEADRETRREIARRVNDEEYL